MHIPARFSRYHEELPPFGQASDLIELLIYDEIGLHHPASDYALYAVDAVSPPRPVQLVWKNSPLGLSTRSYWWAPK